MADELKQALERAAGALGGEPPAERNLAQEVADAQLRSWKAQRAVHVADYAAFHTPRHLIRALLETEDHAGLTLQGEGGVGKTVLVLGEVRAALTPEEWGYKNGYTTPLALYQTLYEHRDRKVLILDDVEGVFTSERALSVLKAALWEVDGARLVQWDSKSDKMDGLPSQFFMRAKLIILCNRIPHSDDLSMRALLSRTISYEVAFSYQQKLSLCWRFLNREHSLTDEQRSAVWRLLQECTNVATRDFNFRTLRRAIAFVRYDVGKAEALFRATLAVDEHREAYLAALKEAVRVADQVRIFTSLTGKSRATFFRVKREMQRDLKVSAKAQVTPATEEAHGNRSK